MPTDMAVQEEILAQIMIVINVQMGHLDHILHVHLFYVPMDPLDLGQLVQNHLDVLTDQRDHILHAP